MLFDGVQLSRASALNNIRASFLSLMFTPARNQNLTTACTKCFNRKPGCMETEGAERQEKEQM